VQRAFVLCPLQLWLRVLNSLFIPLSVSLLCTNCLLAKTHISTRKAIAAGTLHSGGIVRACVRCGADERLEQEGEIRIVRWRVIDRYTELSISSRNVDLTEGRERCTIFKARTGTRSEEEHSNVLSFAPGRRRFLFHVH